MKDKAYYNRRRHRIKSGDFTEAVYLCHLAYTYGKEYDVDAFLSELFPDAWPHGFNDREQWRIREALARKLEQAFGEDRTGNVPKWLRADIEKPWHYMAKVIRNAAEDLRREESGCKKKRERTSKKQEDGRALPGTKHEVDHEAEETEEAPETLPKTGKGMRGFVVEDEEFKAPKGGSEDLKHMDHWLRGDDVLGYDNRDPRVQGLRRLAERGQYPNNFRARFCLYILSHGWGYDTAWGALSPDARRSLQRAAREMRGDSYKGRRKGSRDKHPAIEVLERLKMLDLRIRRRRDPEEIWVEFTKILNIVRLLDEEANMLLVPLMWEAAQDIKAIKDSL
jgi:hypothetical protein